MAVKKLWGGDIVVSTEIVTDKLFMSVANVHDFSAV